MNIIRRNRDRESSEGTLRPSRDATDAREVKGGMSDEPIRLLRFRVIVFGLLVSLGGFIFGTSACIHRHSALYASSGSRLSPLKHPSPHKHTH